MYLIALLTLAVALLRFTIPGHGLTYAGSIEAFSHIWVGVLIALCFRPKFKQLAFWGLVAITLLEIVMFLVDAYGRSMFPGVGG